MRLRRRAVVILARMRRRWRVVVLFCLSISFAEAQHLADAHAFVSKLYDSYEHPACPECPIFDKQAPRIFSPSLLLLIRRDEAKTPKGYVGALDFDPICACQDWHGLHVIELEITRTRRSRAAADVVVGYAAGTKQTIRLSLLQTPRGWRVDDVSTTDVASLRKLLK